jgi:hypothetical protein
MVHTIHALCVARVRNAAPDLNNQSIVTLHTNICQVIIVQSPSMAATSVSLIINGGCPCRGQPFMYSYLSNVGGKTSYQYLLKL